VSSDDKEIDARSKVLPALALLLPVKNSNNIRGRDKLNTCTMADLPSRADELRARWTSHSRPRADYMVWSHLAVLLYVNMEVFSDKCFGVARCGRLSLTLGPQRPPLSFPSASPQGCL
jgi:hypothetical protein